jgi:flagellar basal-body rod protein FlgC
MSIFSMFSVSGSGMEAQRLRAQLLVENIANAETTRTAEGGPYRRKDVSFSTQSLGEMEPGNFNSHLNQAINGVSVDSVHVDDRSPQLRYQPGHPDANSDGYVAYPNLNPAEEMVDLLSATRSYQANVSAVSAAKDMIQRSIDLFR